MFKHCRGEVLRLIDNKNCASSLGMSVQQVMIQCVGQRFHAIGLSGNINAQFLANREEKLISGDLWIQDNGDIRIIRHAVQQQGPYERRLACTHLTG